MGRDRERKEQRLIRVCVFAENQGLGLLSPCGPEKEERLEEEEKKRAFLSHPTQPKLSNEHRQAPSSPLLTLLFLLWPLALDWKPFSLPSPPKQIVKSQKTSQRED
jgi:hypothetical protein